MMTMLQYPGRERYPGVEEPVLNFLASPQIREGGRGREPVPHSVAVDRYCRSADKQNSPERASIYYVIVGDSMEKMIK